MGLGGSILVFRAMNIPGIAPTTKPTLGLSQETLALAVAAPESQPPLSWDWISSSLLSKRSGRTIAANRWPWVSVHTYLCVRLFVRLFVWFYFLFIFFVGDIASSQGHISRRRDLHTLAISNQHAPER